MAVTLTTKFYETDTPSWKDLSKIVFTSPNMDSPNTAGTRSHVLPGQSDIGLWYEDTSNMYRIEAAQYEVDDGDQGKYITLNENFSFPAVSTLEIAESNKQGFIYYIKDQVGRTVAYTTGSTVSSGTATFTASHDNSDAVYAVHSYEDLGDPNNMIYCWSPTITEAGGWLQVEYTTPTRVTKISFKGKWGDDGGVIQHSVVKNFKFQARQDTGDEWTTLLDDENTNVPNAEATFEVYNDVKYKYYRMFCEDGYAANPLVPSISYLKFYDYEYTPNPGLSTVDLYLEDSAYSMSIDDANIPDPTASGVDYLLTVHVDAATSSGTGTVVSGSRYFLTSGGDEGGTGALQVTNAIKFEVTSGEAYDCRLTAWDDATHSTTDNEIIADDHCRVSAEAYYIEGTDILSPTSKQLIFSPIYNRIFKGNSVVNSVKYYYGDFNMKYRYQSGETGDFLIFKPMLYNITDAVSYGVHDFVIVLHYSYT
jgi:hypothetical protein